jgi:hypothetical protein
MNKDRKLFYHNEQTLMLVSKKGILRELKVPFQVKAVQPIGIIKIGTLVYAEAVTQHQQFKIMYRVLNQWMPYQYFLIVIEFEIIVNYR